LYTFSADNWRRPPREVGALMRLFKHHLRAEIDTLIDNGVRLTVIGRRDRLSLRLRTEIDAAEAATAQGRTLDLRLAIDYSSRDAILRAAVRLGSESDPSRETFSRLLANEHEPDARASDVDLLIRTGGEQRLSDFMLWECAYAELYFSDCMWPDFGAADLGAALADFHTRQRRFGALPAAVAG
jgi:undecaprenyl diphosphate synthase